MAKITVSLSQTEIAQAVNFWIDAGMPQHRTNMVTFNYDKMSGHPTDPGSGVTCSASMPVNDYKPLFPIDRS